MTYLLVRCTLADLVPNPEIYGYIKVQIQNYCDNNIYYTLFKLKTWIAYIMIFSLSFPVIIDV
jgi:hypothetical protein